MTYREIVYMCLDELKLHSDDAKFTEDHIIFLLSKYRALILKQRYADIRKAIPDSNYQTVCLDLKEVPAIASGPCEDGVYLRSVQKIPNTMELGSTKIFPVSDFYKGGITFVSRDRMKYVGHNRFLPNIIYCSLGPDQYLYFKSSNPQYLYLQKVRMTAIFEDPEKAASISCEGEGEEPCDLMDKKFPMEESLVPVILEMILKDLGVSIYRPGDEENNANDGLNKVKSSDGKG